MIIGTHLYKGLNCVLLLGEVLLEQLKYLPVLYIMVYQELRDDDKRYIFVLIYKYSNKS